MIRAWRLRWVFPSWCFSLRQSGTLFLSIFLFALAERKNEKQNMKSTMLSQAVAT